MAPELFDQLSKIECPNRFRTYGNLVCDKDCNKMRKKGILKITIGSAHRGPAEMNSTRNHGVAGSVPGLAR